MYDQFGLVLVVNHACNLRCRYCYTGEKYHRSMTESLGRKAIDRALASISPGGVLELGFFGGEPLVEAPLIHAALAPVKSLFRLLATSILARGLSGRMTTPIRCGLPASAWTGAIFSPLFRRPVEMIRHVRNAPCNKPAIRPAGAVTTFARATSIVGTAISYSETILAIPRTADMMARWRPS